MMMNYGIIELVIILAVLALVAVVVGGIALVLFFVMRRPGAASGSRRWSPASRCG